jgi:hypothetical protein
MGKWKIKLRRHEGQRDWLTQNTMHAKFAETIVYGNLYSPSRFTRAMDNQVIFMDNVLI